MASARPFVVMVDDDMFYALIIRKAFERSHSGVEFKHIASGREFLNYIDTAQGQAPPPSDRWPDVILLDINMPEMTGFQVLRALRGDPKKKHLPVTMLTTSSQPEDIDISYSEGANSYVVKPGSVAEMQDFVETFHAFWFKLAQLPSSVAVSQS